MLMRACSVHASVRGAYIDFSTLVGLQLPWQLHGDIAGVVVSEKGANASPPPAVLELVAQAAAIGPHDGFLELFVAGEVHHPHSGCGCVLVAPPKRLASNGLLPRPARSRALLRYGLLGGARRPTPHVGGPSSDGGLLASSRGARSALCRTSPCIGGAEDTVSCNDHLAGRRRMGGDELLRQRSRLKGLEPSLRELVDLLLAFVPSPFVSLSLTIWVLE